MDIPTFQAWCHHGQGAYLVPRLRVKWAIEAAVQKRDYERARDPQAQQDAAFFQGMRGGRCDPLEQCAFADEGDEESAA